MYRNHDLRNIRRQHGKNFLTEEIAGSDPFPLFEKWMQDALDASLPEPNAMTLATSTKDGAPSCRIMLLKSYDDRGFVFYTNYESRKGEELRANPFASLLFFWIELERQIRIEGKIERVSSEESDIYFHSRPRESRLGAHASSQSNVVPSREFLDRSFEDAEKKFADQNIARPERWGGYRLIPVSVEFWQGRPNRMHDRIRFVQTGSHIWTRERLSP